MRMKKYMILFAAVLLAACTAKEMPDSVKPEEAVDTPRQALTFMADAVVGLERLLE